VEIIDTFEAQRDWFRSGGDPLHAAELKEMMLTLVPNLQAVSFQMKPCVITSTPHGYPYIEALEPGQVYAAVGGCGASAKSSNELGRLAARLVADEAWRDDLAEVFFQA
jgi:sarcosine oxidase